MRVPRACRTAQWSPCNDWIRRCDSHGTDQWRRLAKRHWALIRQSRCLQPTEADVSSREMDLKSNDVDQPRNERGFLLMVCVC